MTLNLNFSPQLWPSCVLHRVSLQIMPALFLFLIAATAAYAAPQENEKESLIIEGNKASDVFGLGRSVVVRGSVRDGVVSFGGDVIVEGRVDGDVAAIGGSVLQREGSFIGGDVIVLGGTYHHGKSAPGRNPASRTLMYAGYEEELREMARNPASLLTPRLTPVYLGQRLLSVLFWFVLSLMITAITPGAVSRAAMRLQLTSIHVAVIGLLGSLVLVFGSTISLYTLPPMLGMFVGVMILVLLIVSYTFGRVAIHAATGRWLQRLILPEEKHSETVALLLGAGVWAIILTLPYLWPFCVAGLLVTSLGLTLTAKYRIAWKRD